MQYVGGTQRYL